MSIYVLISAIATTPATEVPIINVPPPVTISTSSPSGRPPQAQKSNPIPKANPGTWATTSDYPSIALQKQIEGTTSFRVTVGPDGMVTDCEITASSGSSELDLATCTNVSRRARFDPALDTSGKPIAGKYSNRIRWQIPSYAPMASYPRGPVMMDSTWTRILSKDFPLQALVEKRQGFVKIELSVSAIGVVDGCQILETSKHADLDVATCKIASGQAKFVPALDVMGQPTAGRVQTRIDWRIPGENAVPINQAARPPVVMPKGLLPKAGTTGMVYTVAADGSLTDCNRQPQIEETNSANPDAICKLNIKFEPYTDAEGKPVARRVTIKTTVELEDVQ